MRRGLARLPIEAVVAAFVGSLAGAALVGAHGGDEAMLHGCYEAGGPLRVIAPTESCNAATETPVDWRIQGSPGPSGDVGPTGATGATGAAGADGARGQSGPEYRFRVVSEDDSRYGPGKAVRVACRKDERAVAGGMEGAVNWEFLPQFSEPSEDRTAWRIGAVGGRDTNYGWTLRGYAICAREVAR